MACDWARWAGCAGTAAGTAGWISIAHSAARRLKISNPARKEPTMDETTVASLLAHAEPLAALSIAHLSPTTRQKLADDDLSVNAYPNEFGGFVYVGAPSLRTRGLRQGCLKGF